MDKESTSRTFAFGNPSNSSSAEECQLSHRSKSSSTNSTTPFGMKAADATCYKALTSVFLALPFFLVVAHKVYTVCGWSLAKRVSHPRHRHPAFLPLTQKKATDLWPHEREANLFSAHVVLHDPHCEEIAPSAVQLSIVMALRFGILANSNGLV